MSRPQGLLVQGNIDTSKLPPVANPAGGVSTVFSQSFGTDKGEVLIPRVVGGKVVSPQAAFAEYQRTGKHLGIFDTPESATAFAEQLHQSEAARIGQVNLPLNSTDPNIQALARQQTQEFNQLKVQAAVQYAAQHSPDKYATALKAQNMVGIPAPVAASVPDTAQQIRQRELLQQIAKSDPKVAEFLTGNVDHLTVAQDEIPLLNQVADLAFRFMFKPASLIPADLFKEIPGALGAGFVGARRGLESAVAGAARFTPDPFGTSKAAADAIDRDVASLSDVERAFVRQESKLSPVKKGILSGIRGTTEFALPTVVGLLTGASGAAAILGGVMAGGNTRAEAKADGASETRADIAGVGTATIQTVAMNLPLKYLVDFFKLPTLRAFIVHQAASIGAGTMAGVIQSASDQIVLHPEKTLGDFVNEQPAAIGENIIAAITQAAIQEGSVFTIDRVAARQMQKEAAKHNQKILTTLDTLMSSSKLKGRAPEVVNAFAKAIVKDQMVYIKAQDLIDVLDKNGIDLDEVRDNVFSVDAQIDDALSRGTDIEIPMDEYLSQIAGEKYNKELIPKTSMGEVPSVEEVDEFDESRAVEEAKKALDEATVVVGIQNEIAAQLLAARPDLYTKETAATTAVMFSAFYASMGEKLGITTEEAAALAPLKVLFRELNPTESQDIQGEHQYMGGKEHLTEIRLTPGADLVTALHEGGHFLLSIYSQLADLPGTPESIKAEMATVFTWLKARSATEFYSMPPAEQTARHEKFAESFEHYLFTGEAPTESLKPFFRDVSGWYRKLYKSLENMPNHFSPEVKAVVDRMLAASDVVDAAQAQLWAVPMFDSKDKAGLSDEEWIKYQQAGIEATQIAIDELQTKSLRGMGLLRRKIGREIKKLQDIAADRRKEAEAVAQAEVDAQPVRLAEKFLRTGKVATASGLPQTFKEHKFSKADVDALYAGLPKENRPDTEKIKDLIAAKGGVGPDEVAARFGFTSGDKLIRELIAIGPDAYEVEARADRIMLEHYGDLGDPETIAKAADAAVHNDARIKFAAMELNALLRATKSKGATKEQRAQGIKIETLAKAAKKLAIAAIGRKAVGRLRVRDFELAEARSAKRSLAALGRGELVVAAMEKRNQILNGMAAKMAAQTVDDIASDLGYVKKFKKETLDQRIGRDTREQINHILQQMGLQEPEQITRPALVDWMTEQAANSFVNPDIIPDWVETKGLQDYKSLTVNEFNDVMDMIRALEKAGRNRQSTIASKKYETFLEAEEALTNVIIGSKAAREGGPEVVEPEPSKVKKGLSELVHFDARMRQFDGREDNGTAYNLLTKPKNEAADVEHELLKQYMTKLVKLAEKHLSGRSMDTKLDIPGLDFPLTVREILGVAQWTGTVESRQRLRDGGIFGKTKELTNLQIQAILNALTKPEMDYVQATWDLVGELWPKIVKAETDRIGYAPKKAEINPVITQHGEYPGGYVSIRYDSRNEGWVDPDALDNVIEKTRLGKHVSNSTNQGFTKTRRAVLKNKALLMDPRVVTAHLSTVIHDLAFHNWAVDASRLFASGKVRTAIRDRYGREVLKTIDEDVQRFIAGSRPAAASIEKMMGYIRKGAIISTLGFNFHSAAMMALHPLQAAHFIGAKYILAGAARMLVHGGQMDLLSYVRERSLFMKNQTDTFIPELIKFNDALSTKSKARKAAGKAVNFVSDTLGFAMARGMMTMASTWVWYGAELRGINELYMNAEEAARYADQVVLDSAGSGRLTDRTNFETSSAMGQLLTMYYTFFSRTYAISREIVQDGSKSPTNAVAAAYKFGMVIGVPVLIKGLFEAYTRHEHPEDKLTPEFFGRELASFILNMAPVFREFSALVEGRDYSGPPAMKWIQDLYNVAKDSREIFDPTTKRPRSPINQEKLDEKWLHDLGTAAGPALHLPTGELDKSLRGLVEYLRENNNPEQIFFGPEIKEK